MELKSNPAAACGLLGLGHNYLVVIDKQGSDSLPNVLNRAEVVQFSVWSEETFDLSFWIVDADRLGVNFDELTPRFVRETVKNRIDGDLTITTNVRGRAFSPLNA